MRIDPKAEKLTRTMLGHAVKDELDELAKVIQGINNDRLFADCLGLCTNIAGYIVVDVMGPGWPSEAGLRHMARRMVESENKVQLDETAVFDYLEKAALEAQPWDQVFSNIQDAAGWPIIITASLMLSFCPREKTLWEYLDVVEEALETADAVKQSALPAMILRAHRLGDNRVR